MLSIKTLLAMFAICMVMTFLAFMVDSMAGFGFIYLAHLFITEVKDYEDEQ